ncbi:hypothetical protein PILCRDRAFT_11106 [Piloderma croceum F 1598]|uniref:Uncharacterized protein n=1 Tax=Piloderma croceum (strain F 1598) TaxID=765440 RepID=A0A0C3F1N0_PILCF|nr:hypothetical protein PILCRDRAFT_11106 [Piloderma croceum F 1598]
MPHKSKGVKKPAGQKNDFTGKKLQLLTNFAGHFREAIDNKTPLEFYDKITMLAIKQWGYHKDYNVLTIEDEIEGDGDNNNKIPSQFASVDGDKDEDEDMLTAKEAERRQKIYKKLRTKLQQWYHRKYKHILDTGSHTPAGPLTNPFVILPSDPSKPHRMAEINMYMAMYYETQIKEEAERHVIIAEQKFDQTTEEERADQGLKKPTTKEAVKARIEEFYNEQLEAWNGKHNVPKTPQEYYHQLQTAGKFLHPITETISSMMGVPVMIMMPVPIPEKNGEIKCLSVHVIKQGALTISTWHKQDPLGYKEAEKLLVAWAKTQFTLEELRSCSLPTTASVHTSTPIAAQTSNPSTPNRLPAKSSSPESRSITPQPSPMLERTHLQMPPQTQVPLMPLSPPHQYHSPSIALAIPLPHWPVHPSTPPEDHMDMECTGTLLFSPTHQACPSPVSSSTPPEDRLDMECSGMPLLVSLTRPHLPGPQVLPQQGACQPLDTSSWPQHALDTYHYLKDVTTVGENGEKVVHARGGGDEWLRCVQKFMEFQRQAGFPDEGQGYPTNNKPLEISYWQKNHQSWKDQGLHKKSLAVFETEWWCWWKLLQPESRGANHAEYMNVPTVNMDWAKLCAPGQNGFLLVMVSLAWWGTLCGHSNGWQLAMTDATVALVSTLH